MKIKNLCEKLYTIIKEDYDTDEVEVSDSDIHRYLDLRYDSEEIINLAQQFNPKIDNADLDAAYSEIINHFDEISSKDGSKDLIDLNSYLEDQINKDYNIEL